MRSVLRSIGLVCIVFCVGSLLTGCTSTTFRIAIPGFAAGAVDGIWLWKQTETGFTRVCRFDISDPFVDGGQEQVDYQQVCLDGRPSSPPWRAAVERLASDPDTVTLKLVYRPNGTPTTHRATAFNSAGESTLSSTSLQL